jgi:hypothetical protein
MLRRLATWLLLSLIAVSLLPAAARAQEGDAITWQIVPGYDGSYRAGTWFPVTITVANSGPDVRGTIEVRLVGGNSPTWSQPIDLPHNANKRLTMPVLAETNRDGAVQAEVVLRDSSRVIIKRELVRTTSLGTFQPVMGVLSDESSALPELGGVTSAERFGDTRLVRLTPATLPDRAEYLQTVNALFAHAVDLSSLSESQRAALRGWVIAGGTLVIGGDARLLRDLGDLMPATTDESSFEFDPRALGGDSGWQVRPTAPPLRALRLIPREGADVAIASDGRPLIVRDRLGAGVLYLAAFDLAALRDAGDPADFWTRVLVLPSGQQPLAVQLREQGFWTMQQAIRLPALRLPSTGGLLGFLLLYIATVGPLNYLVLSRFDRREWAYLTVPILVILFSVGAYVWGTAGRGTAPNLTQLSVVRVAGDSAQGQATSFIALFSPQRRTYNVAVDRDALLSDLIPAWQRQGGPVDVQYAEADTRAGDLLVDVGGVRALMVEQTVEAPVVEVRWRTVDGEEQVTLRNRSDATIDDVLLVRGDGQTQTVEPLAPGEERTVRLRPLGFIQGGGGLAPGGAVIDRQTVINQLAGALVPTAWQVAVVEPPMMGIEPVRPLREQIDARNLQPDSRRELYVLGWRSVAPVPIMLDGQPAATQGETLYVWSARREG